MNSLKDILKSISEVLQTPAETYQDRKDQTYNRIARDQPAYISIVYPLICVLVGLNFGNTSISTENIWGYIFNILTSLTICVPALFFLYKMLIRDISEFVVEKIVFALMGQPHRSVLRKTGKSWRLSQSERKEIFNKVQESFNIQVDQKYREDNDKDIDCCEQRADKNLSDCLDKFHHKLKNQDYIKKDPIAFEFNCFYGFYRNLAGGLTLNILLMSIFLLVNRLTGSLNQGIFNISAVIQFISNSIWWVVGFTAMIYILAYFARIKHKKQQLHLFLSCQSMPTNQP